MDINYGRGPVSGWGNDFLEFVEGIIGSRFPDVLEGGVGDERSRFYRCDNRFVGGRGNDVLVGGWGTDILLGGVGDDDIYPGSSFPSTGQIADGGDGNDTVSYGPYTGDRYATFDPVYDLRVSLAAGTATGSSIADVITGFENASGGFEDDVIVGSSEGNVLRGHDGTDRVYGRAGNDLLFGESDDDSLDGGGGRDRCRQGPGVGATVRCEIVFKSEHRSSA